jgi:hypothetical protein
MHGRDGSRRSKHVTIQLLFAIACVTRLALDADALLAQSAPACSSDSAFAWLDFWVGRWDVYVHDRRVGQDDVAKILSGCAVTESWTSASGQHGFSLFYFLPVPRTWRQVWVTDNALTRGGVKEKELVERFADGGVRFQGTLRLPGGGSYLDRTTLTPLASNRVRQVIETSTDDGHSWQTSFDAVYIRRP